MIYITGDTHRDFERIERFCDRMKTTEDDIMIILGDVGVNYYGGVRDEYIRRRLSQIPITFFCVHGNHEIRPHNLSDIYHLDTFAGSAVYVDQNHPNQLFAIDGLTYNLGGRECLVIGGAYSVDKEWRTPFVNWWPDEQVSSKDKKFIRQTLEERGWKHDIILSHTCPEKYTPVEVFLPGIDQKKVDKSMEKWLDTIEDRLDYNKWYCGHWHTDKSIDKMEFMFEDIVEFGGYHGTDQGTRHR